MRWFDAGHFFYPQDAQACSYLPSKYGFTQTMSIIPEYVQLAEKVQRVLPPRQVIALYLPKIRDEEFRDDFGFVFLDDGSIGPFYVCLEGVLEALWKRYPKPDAVSMPLAELLEFLASEDLPERALGIGAYNALSQQLMKVAGYQPTTRPKSAKNQSTEPLSKIGMIGYFCPVVEKLTAKGQQVVVLEKRPERIVPHPLVTATTHPADLSDCDSIICTASVLINDSLDDILQHTGNAADFSLLGPTSSGLPDILFARGVHCAGGIHFPERKRLLECLKQEESWGSAGNKYDIRRDDYPGVDALLESAEARL